MKDADKSNHEAWDDKFHHLLWQLQEYQEAKDHPQAQVVNIEVEELFVNTPNLHKFALTSSGSNNASSL